MDPQIQKKWSCDDENFHDSVMSESPTVEEGASQFVCKFVEFCSYITEKTYNVCYREEFEQCKIHRMDKTYIELATFEEFATAEVQTVAKRCLPSHDNFQSAA